TAMIAIAHSARIAIDPCSARLPRIPHPYDQGGPRRRVGRGEFNAQQAGQMTQAIPPVMPGRCLAGPVRAEIRDLEIANAAGEDAALDPRVGAGSGRLTAQDEAAFATRNIEPDLD